MTAGVLLHYHGGAVYALPTADRHVWRVAGIEVDVVLVAEHAETGKVIGLEALTDLASAAAHARRLAAEAAPKRTGKAKGKSKRRVAAKARGR